jgi:hypothetical protein
MSGAKPIALSRNVAVSADSGMENLWGITMSRPPAKRLRPVLYAVKLMVRLLAIRGRLPPAMSRKLVSIAVLPEENPVVIAAELFNKYFSK